MSSATGVLMVYIGLAIVFDFRPGITYSVALGMLHIFRIVPKNPITTPSLMLLLVLPILLEIDQICPPYFLANSYEDFRSTVHNSSPWTWLGIPLYALSKSFKCCYLTSWCSLFSWYEEFVARRWLAQPGGRVTDNLRHVKMGNSRRSCNSYQIWKVLRPKHSSIPKWECANK
jgi:hypothetical protein